LEYLKRVFAFSLQSWARINKVTRQKGYLVIFDSTHWIFYNCSHNVLWVLLAKEGVILSIWKLEKHLVIEFDINPTGDDPIVDLMGIYLTLYLIWVEGNYLIRKKFHWVWKLSVLPLFGLGIQRIFLHCHIVVTSWQLYTITFPIMVAYGLLCLMKTEWPLSSAQARWWLQQYLEPTTRLGHPCMWGESQQKTLVSLGLSAIYLSYTLLTLLVTKSDKMNLIE